MSDAPRRSHRLFFALWPDEDLRARIERDTREIVKRSGGRQVASRNLHITLAFLGQIDAARLEEVKTAAGGVRANAFEIVLDEIATWRRSGVLCLTTRQPPAAAQELARALRSELSARDFAPGEQEFRPHVTLARDVRRGRSLAALIAPLPWRVEDFALVESNMTKAGSEYAVLGRWPLAPVEQSGPTG